MFFQGPVFEDRLEGDGGISSKYLSKESSLKKPKPMAKFLVKRRAENIRRAEEKYISEGFSEDVLALDNDISKDNVLGEYRDNEILNGFSSDDYLSSFGED